MSCQEYVTKIEVIKSLIESQDPDLVYVSVDEIHWTDKLKSQDATGSGWTNHPEYEFWLDEFTILGGLEKLIKDNPALLAQIAESAIS